MGQYPRSREVYRLKHVGVPRLVSIALIGCLLPVGYALAAVDRLATDAHAFQQSAVESAARRLQLPRCFVCPSPATPDHESAAPLVIPAAIQRLIDLLVSGSSDQTEPIADSASPAGDVAGGTIAPADETATGDNRADTTATQASELPLDPQAGEIVSQSVAAVPKPKSSAPAPGAAPDAPAGGNAPAQAGQGSDDPVVN